MNGVDVSNMTDEIDVDKNNVLRAKRKLQVNGFILKKQGLGGHTISNEDDNARLTNLLKRQSQPGRKRIFLILFILQEEGYTTLAYKIIAQPLNHF